jgi:hypothetical protein
MRQYAAEKLGESGEADATRSRHRDHYTALAALLEGPSDSSYGQRVDQTEAEIDNLRAAFGWSRESGDAELALALASSLSPLWQPRPAEGIAWFNAVLDDGGNRLDIAPAVRARALADRVLLVTMIGWDAASKDNAEEALAIARKLDNPALLARALAACSLINLDAEAAREYRAEAIGLARSLGDTLRLSHILSVEAIVAAMKGEAAAVRAVAQEGCELADAIGFRAAAIRCHFSLAQVQLASGDFAGAVTHFTAVTAQAEAGHYVNFARYGLAGQAMALAWQGDVGAARAAAGDAVEGIDELGIGSAGGRRCRDRTERNQCGLPTQKERSARGSCRVALSPCAGRTGKRRSRRGARPSRRGGRNRRGLVLDVGVDHTRPRRRRAGPTRTR